MAGENQLYLKKFKKGKGEQNQTNTFENSFENTMNLFDRVI